MVLCFAAMSAMAQAPEKDSKVLRVVAYNVGVFSKYADDSTHDIANMMHEIDADAIAVCELDSCNRRHATYQLERFAQALGDWDFRFGAAMQWKGGAYGTGVVTKCDIIDSFKISLPKGDGHEPRVCAVAETKDYVIAAAHIDHGSEEVRMEQARQITDELKCRYGRSRKPVFLCGDLNATPDSPTLQLLSEDWTVLSDLSSTFPSSAPRICIDFIMVLDNRARCKVVETAVLTKFDTADVTKMSDHLPVFVDVQIR